MNYESSMPYRDGYDGLAMYCSDGRFAGPCDDFIHHSLRMTRCDRVVLPGGARRLIPDDPNAADAPRVLKDVTFLIEAHAIKRVVLIAHADCGYYSFRVMLSPDTMLPTQQTDLARAAGVLLDQMPYLKIEGYYAHRTADDKIHFKACDLSEAAVRAAKEQA